MNNPPIDNSVDLRNEICHSFELNKEEEKRKEQHPVIRFPQFNVAKKENESEDADPISFANDNWGVLSVFDGMGGAGARKYKHEGTGEEHTAAYWGSRIVKDSVLTMVKNCPKDVSPLQYIETNLHKEIKINLDKKIQEFSNVNSTVWNKMVRKLPTTMAMLAYEIKEDYVEVNSYWAGDSRLYMLTKDKLTFLSIDDADAEDGDPFSPANMDLAMNNAISQEKEFVINKVDCSFSISSDSPFILIAATDGCFGYYKNPIEFEAMLRYGLLRSSDPASFMERVKQAIIDNVQQDDFSMVAVAFGSSNFEALKKTFANQDATITTEYFKWKRKYDRKLRRYKSKIFDLEKKLIANRDKMEECYSYVEKENMEWYAKYKETYEVVSRSEIKSV